jgi:hypothetical protein
MLFQSLEQIWKSNLYGKLKETTRLNKMMDLEQFISDFLNPPNTYQSLTIDRVLLALLVSFTINIFIFYIYRKTFKGIVYTREFNVGLVLTGLVVTLIVLPISSNIALSLGMVGALSIVRFRTAIKDPKDIVFTFWVIAVGPDPYLLIVHYASEAEAEVQAALPKYKIRSRTANADGVELMGEVRLNTKEVPKVDELLKIKGVKDASVVSYTSSST